MKDETVQWQLKPSREGQTANGKALVGSRLTQADIQALKNKGFADWFMPVRQDNPAPVAETPAQPANPAPESPKEDRKKVGSGVEKLAPPSTENENGE